jgi:signal transduction histidine kinase
MIQVILMLMKSLRHLWILIDRHPLTTDVILASVLAGLALLSVAANWGSGQQVTFITALLLTLVLILPLMARRYFPLAVLLFMTAIELYYRFLLIPEPRYTAYALLFAVASAAAFGRRQWRTWVISAVIFIEMTAILYLGLFSDSGWVQGSIPAQVLQLLLNLFLFGAAGWIGEVFRSRRERETELKHRTEQLKLEREENARRAVLEERVRIARELHDVVAHHVSVMGIQAGAARRVLEKQPDKAHEALSTIEKSSRHAISELHRLLGLLRPKKQIDKTSPQPSLKQLDTLVKEMYSVGLPVELRIVGKERSIPESVDLSAYRIIQEALTNTLKHAGPAKANVTVTYSGNTIELNITDNGLGKIAEESLPSSGRGLIGMKERVNLHGGQLETGNIDGGGFFVRVELPLSEKAA